LHRPLLARRRRGRHAHTVTGALCSDGNCLCASNADIVVVGLYLAAIEAHTVHVEPFVAAAVALHPVHLSPGWLVAVLRPALLLVVLLRRLLRPLRVLLLTASRIIASSGCSLAAGGVAVQIGTAVAIVRAVIIIVVVIIGGCG